MINKIYEHGLYDSDVTIIKRLGDSYKLIHCRSVRKSGIETNNNDKKNKKYDIKLDNSLSRSKTRIKEYALCNDWKYFCTFTIDKNNKDSLYRYDLKRYYKEFAKFISNYNRYCKKHEIIKYLFVPEKHNDGAWHIHGLITGIRENDLYINEYGYLSWRKYENKFGFISMGKIKNIKKTSNYIMKYITKEVEKNVTEVNQHIYFSSNGLNKAETIFKGKAIYPINHKWDFIHEENYCMIKSYDSLEEMAEIKFL